ncbi:MAG: hypothetical protein ABIH87_01615 [bacterium]
MQDRLIRVISKPSWAEIWLLLVDEDEENADRDMDFSALAGVIVDHLATDMRGDHPVVLALLELVGYPELSRFSPYRKSCIGSDKKYLFVCHKNIFVHLNYVFLKNRVYHFKLSSNDVMVLL